MYLREISHLAVNIIIVVMDTKAFNNIEIDTSIMLILIEILSNICLSQ